MPLHTTWFLIAGIIIYILFWICAAWIILLIIWIIKIKRNKSENSVRWWKRFLRILPIALIVLFSFWFVSHKLWAFDTSYDYIPTENWNGDIRFNNWFYDGVDLDEKYQCLEEYNNCMELGRQWYEIECVPCY